MSILVMSQVWKHGPADRSDLLVLLALADFADDDGYCWPSVRALAEKARLGERGLQKVLRRLEDQGLIEVATGKGRHGCNQYWILLDAMQQIRMPVDSVEQNENDKEALNTVHPLNQVHPEQECINPEPGSPPEHGSPRTGEQKPRTSVQKTRTGVHPNRQEPSRTVNALSGAREARMPVDNFAESEMGWFVEHCPSLSLAALETEHQKLAARHPGGVTLAEYRVWMLDAERHFADKRQQRLGALSAAEVSRAVGNLQRTAGSH